MPRKPTGKTTRDATGRVVTVKGKAANRAGTLYFDGDRWRATWYDDTGKRHQIGARTQADAIARRAQAITDGAVTGGQFTKRTTVGELATWWLDTIARHRVRPSSIGRYRDRVQRLGGLRAVAVVALRAEQVASWQADALERGLAPKTVADSRTTLRQVIGQAVELGLVTANIVDRVKPPTRRPTSARALTPDDARLLISAARDQRLGATVAILFVQGWRVSEVLGLAWTDIDWRKGTATVQRAAVYVDGVGTVLGPTKTAGAAGVHHLAPGVLAILKARRQAQAAERLAAGELWTQPTYDGRSIELVFTTHTGGVLARQAVTRTLQTAARGAGLDPTGIATHTGRRTVVTTLYATEGVDLADIARHVGHASPATTAGYVRDLGQRPQRTADAAARALDVT